MENASHHPHLSKAPIVEAIIDIRTKLPADFDLARFKALHESLRPEFSHAQEIKMVELMFEEIQSGHPKQSASDRGLQGYCFRSGDSKNVVQFRQDGFSFHRLEPYTSWAEIFPQASALWMKFVEVAQPIDIARISVRNVNRLRLPYEKLEFGEYLTVPPQAPLGIPPLINSFVTRVVALDPETQTTIAVVQALEPPKDTQYVPVILDIDVFQENLSDLEPDAVLARFETLRQFKNRAFFGSITDKLLEMLK